MAKRKISIVALTVAACAAAAGFVHPALAQYGRGPNTATFFVQDDFGGRSVTLDHPVRNFGAFDMNDKASSVMVRGGRWLVCADADFRGRCEVVDHPIRRLSDIGMDDKISSARPLDGGPGGPGGWGGGPGPSSRFPGGSWAETCRAPEMDGPMLRAQCRDRDGRWRDTRINAARCGGGISNQDGQLVCR